MEHIPPLKLAAIPSLPLESKPHHKDHRFMETPVLAAAEAMLHMAEGLSRQQPLATPICLTDAAFMKFILIADMTPEPASGRTVSFSIQVAGGDGRSPGATLVSTTRSRRLGLTRTKPHLTFTLARHPPSKRVPSPADVSSEGPFFKVAADRIYADLIPFGPAFQNLRKAVALGRQSVKAVAWGGDASIVNELPNALGSPFPFDAAMQAACAWGQRYQGIVAFPVAVSKRVIFKKTQPETAYDIGLVLTGGEADTFFADGCIKTSGGDMCEAFWGLHMRDLSRGRLGVPPWIRPSLRA